MPLLKVALIGSGIYAGLLATNFYAKRAAGVNRALALSGTKGIINIGSGCDWSESAMSFCNLPEVVVNLDVHIADDCPKCEQVNLEVSPLPFTNNEFDVALASHSLEHLVNWESALAEWSRIADHVVLVLPNPFSINSYFNPLHKQHFSFGDMNYMQANWANVEVFA